MIRVVINNETKATSVFTYPDGLQHELSEDEFQSETLGAFTVVTVRKS